MCREKVFTSNESEVLNVIVKARPPVVDFEGSINEGSNKANFER